MNQQINLYQPIFRKQKKVFSAVAMLQVSVIALTLFALTGGYSYLQLRQLEQQQQASLNSLDNIKQQIAQLEAGSRDDTTAKLLEAEIDKITREVEQKKRIADMLTQGVYANTQGFSRHFEAFARQHVNGAWLTNITVENGGSSLNLDGVTFSAELVPVYLQRLLQEDVFSGTSFNVLGMERSLKNPEELSFQVGTKTGDQSNGSS